jgi:hypothetical protein
MPKDFDRVAAIFLEARRLSPRFATGNAVVLAGAALFATQRRIFVNTSVADVIDPRWVALFATLSVISMFCIAVGIQAHIEYRTVDGILYVALVAFYLCVGLLAHRTPLAADRPGLPPLVSVLIAALFCVGVFYALNVGWAFDDAVNVSRSFRHEWLRG